MPTGRDEQILARLTALEIKLGLLIDKLKEVVDQVDENQKRQETKYEGDGTRPSILSRVIALEEFNRTLKWSIGVLYTVIIGLIATLIGRKV